MLDAPLNRVLSCLVCGAGATLCPLVAAAGAGERKPHRIIIASDGVPKATIVLGLNPSDAERSAARELRSYVRKMTTGDDGKAAELPIQTEAEAPQGTRIFVGRSKHVANLDIKLDDLDTNGFVIQTRDNDLVLCGKDDLGTEFAVYTFLEKHCGVRWFWPGEVGQDVPRRRTVTIGRIFDRQQPHFRLRSIGKDSLWRKRIKLAGGPKAVGGHNWGKMVPPAKYGPQHPEYFALVNGTRQKDWKGYNGQHGYQLCTTNPQVIKISVDHVRRFFDEHPDIDLYSVAANDGAGWCECDRCRALDTGKRMSNGVRVLTDRVFAFTNQIAEQIGKTHPDKYVVQLAYQACLEPPERVKIADNVVVMLTVNLEGNYAPKHKENHWRIFRAWSKVTPNLYVYEYFTHTWKPQLPRAMPTAIGQAIPFYKRCGSSLFYAQSMNDFAGEGLNYYITAKLLWDTHLDVDQILDDYCQKAFGNAAEVMKRYFLRLEALWAMAMRTRDRWEHGSGNWAGNPDNYLTMFTPETMQELKGYLEEALRLTDAGEYRQRVNFMMRGWRFTELEVKAFRSLRELSAIGLIHYRKGAPGWSGRKVAGLDTLDIPRNQARALIAQTISTWQERDRYARKLKGSYVIDYGRLKAWNCVDQRFHPVSRLRKVLAAEAGTLTDTKRHVTGQLPDVVKSARSLVACGVTPEVGFNAFHVQGLLVTEDHLYFTSVSMLRSQGWIFKLDRKTMKLLGKRNITVGSDVHPGGIDSDGTSIWVPVAAYRKRSHTHIMTVDPETLEARRRFEVADHIGAVARWRDRLIGANWDAETFYFWTLEGDLKDKRKSPTGVAYQDCKGVGDHLACLGGGYLDLIDVERWKLVKRFAVGKSLKGSSLSREGLGLLADRVFFLPDDGPDARVYEYRFSAKADRAGR